MTGDTVAGAAYLLRGFRLLFKPGIRVYVILPLVINVLVFAGFLWLGANQAQALIDWLLPGGDAWYWALLRGVLWVYSRSPRCSCCISPLPSSPT